MKSVLVSNLSIMSANCGLPAHAEHLYKQQVNTLWINGYKVKSR